MNIAIIGAGTMGSGIAQVAAMAGHSVKLYDVSEAALKNARKQIESHLDKGIERGKVTTEEKEAAIKRLEFTGSFEALTGDLILEAVVEQLDVKQTLFHKLAAQNAETTILATNTSSIPITQIAAGIPNPERVVGIHFFNPAHIMQLVEVVSGVQTSAETADKAFQFVADLGKVPIRAQDAPGFIVNRVARHYYVESLKLLEENVADVEGIDKLLEASGFKMGPFRLMDLIGVDTNFSVTSSMYQLFHYDEKFRPSRIQQQKVDAGHNGRKSGKGFYTYD